MPNLAAARGIIQKPMAPLPQVVARAENAARFGALSMSVAWESPWQQFRSSVRSSVTGPRASKAGPNSGGKHLRVYWIEGRIPGRALTASTLWHIAAVSIMVLPIWGFLPSAQPMAAPMHIELTWDASANDLPPISLPAPAPKPKPLPVKRDEDPQPEVPRGADAYHPRQTILSIPVRVTHPRQTLIQPGAPAVPPKIDPQLPNMVEWAATTPQPKLQLQLTAKAAAPNIKRGDVRDIAAPDIPNQENSPGPLNIAASPVINPAPQLAVSPMSVPVAQQHPVRQENAIAPVIAPDASTGDESLRRVIALSTDPAPPAPVVEVPRGNLAARISISPEGTKSGTPGGADPPGATGTGVPGTAISAGGSNKTGGGSSSLPAAVSITGGSRDPGAGASGGGGIGNRPDGRLNLNPKLSLPARPDSTNSIRNGPSVVGTIDPSIPPDKILSGKEVYTMHIDMPNLTSAAGSWILNFAQIDEGKELAVRPKGRLSAPVLERKVDPEYPPAFIKAHVEGQVILYAIIRKDGSVDSIQRVRGLEPQLDKNAMEALAQWTFRPATREGMPVDIEAVVYIPFRFRAPQDY